MATTLPPKPPPAIISVQQLPVDAAAYVVEAPLLYHAALSNVLKKASAQGVPLTLVTTRNGLVQGNALLLSIAVQNTTTTYLTQFSGRSEGSVQVLSKGQWQAFALDGATLRPISMTAVSPFNLWLQGVVKNAAPISPRSALQNWFWENRKIATY